MLGLALSIVIDHLDEVVVRLGSFLPQAVFADVEESDGRNYHHHCKDSCNQGLCRFGLLFHKGDVT